MTVSPDAAASVPPHTVLRVDVRADDLLFEIGGGTYLVPAGVARLSASIGGNPPDPADLTNAIGLVLDHLDDVERELPMAAFADLIEVRGDGATVVVDVEAGMPTPLSATLTPEALEDLFRTLATETRAERTHNPCLPAAWVHDILGACCVLVALSRRYRPQHLQVTE